MALNLNKMLIAQLNKLISDAQAALASGKTLDDLLI